MTTSMRDKETPVIPASEKNQPCPPLVVKRYSQTATGVPSALVLRIVTEMKIVSEYRYLFTILCIEGCIVEIWSSAVCRMNKIG